MKIKGNYALYAGMVITAIVLFILISKYFSYRQVSKMLPDIDNLAPLTTAVKDQIEDVYALIRQNPNAENIGELGMVYHASALYIEAAQCYKLAISMDDSEWKWNYYLGFLSMEMGNSNDAIENFTRVKSMNESVGLAYYYLGEEFKNVRNYELAEQNLRKISDSGNAKIIPSGTTRSDHFKLSTYATYELSRIYFETEKFESAEKILLKLIEDDKLFGSSYKLLGNIYNLRGDTIRGKKFTVRANDLIQFSPPVDTLIDKLVLLSRSELFLLKKIDEAIRGFHSDWAHQLVNHGLEYLPDNRYMIAKAIEVFLWKNLTDRAIALTDKHIALFKGDYTEIKNMGMIFFQKGLYSQATKYWEQALELKPDELIIRQSLVKSLWSSGNKAESLKILEEILKENRGNQDVLAEATDLLFQYGEKDKAVANLSILLNLYPSNPKAKRLEGQMAQANGEIEKAISLYESSLLNAPDDEQTIRFLGELYLSKQKWENYIRLYKNAQEHDANNPDFLARLGEALISTPVETLRDIETGKDYMERAFTYYNCPPDILIASGSQLAYAYSLLGDKKKAITTISQTINIGRRQKIPASQQSRLENMLIALQNMSE